MSIYIVLRTIALPVALSAGILLFQSFLAPIAHAAGTGQDSMLKVPEALNVLYLDGKARSSSFFSSGGAKATIPPGYHRMVLEYEVIWEIDSDEHDRIVSEPFMVSFTLNAGASYKVVLPQLESVSMAKEFAKQPVIAIIEDETDKIVPTEVAYRLEEKQFLASFGGRETLSVKANQQEPHRSRAISSRQNSGMQSTDIRSAGVQNTGIPSGIEKTASNPKALEMLRYWWGEASYRQQEEFLSLVRARK